MCKVRENALYKGTLENAHTAHVKTFFKVLLGLEEHTHGKTELHGTH